MQYRYNAFVLYAGMPMIIRYESSIKSLSRGERAYEIEKVVAKKIGDNFNPSKITYLKLQFVETFEIFGDCCAGRQLSNNLFPHLPQRRPLR